MRELLHSALLLAERNMAHLRSLGMAGETGGAAWREIPARSAVRHLQAGARRRYRNRSPHQAGRLNLCVIQRLDLRAAAAKLIRGHAAHPTVYSGVAIHGGDICIIDNRGAAREASAPETRVKAATIPGMEHFKRR